MLVLFTVFPCLIATLVLSTTNHDDINGIHAAFYCSPDVYFVSLTPFALSC